VANKNKKQSFVEGAIVLSLSMIIVKLVGAIFKLPLTSILGGEGMGYFSSAYTIFNLFNSIAIAGLPVAISKIVAEKMSLHKYRDVKNILKVSTIFFSLLGIILTVIMFLTSKILAGALNNTGAIFSMLALSPSIFFICIMSIYKGYYQGLNQMTPTAISQVIEALFKMTCGLSFSYLINEKANAEYIVYGTVFGKTMESNSVANDYIMQLSAAGAVFGVTVSCFCGLVYLLIRKRKINHIITKEMLKMPQETEHKSQVLKRIMAIVIPVSMAAAVVNITSVIDLASILTRLTIGLSNDVDTVLSMYQGHIPGDLGIDKIPNFLYGSYSGMAVTIFNLVPSMTMAFGVSALPNITNVFISGNKIKIKKQVNSILKLSALFAIPAGIGIHFMAYPILNFLFESKVDEVFIASVPLKFLGIASIFVAISIPINSILQGIGRADIPVKLMIVGGILKLSINYVLVSIPSINIYGAPIGTIVCYLFIVISSLYLVLMITNVKVNLLDILVKPLIASLACGLVAKATYNLLFSFLNTKYVLLPSIILGAIVYIYIILLLKTINEDDVRMIPKSEKIEHKLKKGGHI